MIENTIKSKIEVNVSVLIIPTFAKWPVKLTVESMPNTMQASCQ